jgi:N6-L-threonylcarbamoyladenine synthase
LGKELGWRTYIPSFQYCTDNAGMIAMTAWYKYQAGQFSPLETTVTARASWQ